jgi:hypothetical protein
MASPRIWRALEAARPVAATLLGVHLLIRSDLNAGSGSWVVEPSRSAWRVADVGVRQGRTQPVWRTSYANRRGRRLAGCRRRQASGAVRAEHGHEDQEDPHHHGPHGRAVRARAGDPLAGTARRAPPGGAGADAWRRSSLPADDDGAARCGGGTGGAWGRLDRWHSVLFRRLTGLADGLAPKERRYVRARFAPMSLGPPLPTRWRVGIQRSLCGAILAAEANHSPAYRRCYGDRRSDPHADGTTIPEIA